MEEGATECKPTEGKPLPEEGVTECKSTEGKPLPEGGMTECKPTETKPLPSERVTEGESMEGKSLPEEGAMEGKSVAAKREGAASHEAAPASKSGPTKAAAAKRRSRKAAAAKGRSSKAATTKTAVKGRRTHSPSGRSDRRGGQSGHDVAHHDASPLLGDAPQPLGRKLGSSYRVAACGIVARLQQPDAMKSEFLNGSQPDEKTLRHGVPESEPGRRTTFVRVQ
jgi:hypothetical protein